MPALFALLTKVKHIILAIQLPSINVSSLDPPHRVQLCMDQLCSFSGLGNHSGESSCVSVDHCSESCSWDVSSKITISKHASVS